MWNPSFLLHALMVLLIVGLLIILPIISAQMYTMIKEELAEFSKIRRAELRKIKKDNDEFFTKLVEQYRSDAVNTAPLWR